MSLRDKNSKQYLWQIIVFFMIVLLFVWAVPRIFSKHTAQVKTNDNIYSINSQEFVGFEKCEISANLSATMTRLIKEGKPIKKKNNTLTYEIRSEIMGLPIKEITLGVCDMDNSSQACGWGSFLALVSTKPLAEAKSQLKTQTGIDYTEEIRDKESDSTLRPVLAVEQNSNESVLYCDPGLL